MPSWPIDTTRQHLPGEGAFFDAPQAEPVEQSSPRSTVPQRLSSRIVSGTRLPYRTTDSSPASASSPRAPSPTPSEAPSTATRTASPTHPGPPPAHGHASLPAVPQDAFFDPNVGVRPRLRHNASQRTEQALPTVPEQADTPAAPAIDAPVSQAQPTPPAPTQVATQPATQAAPTQLRHPPSLPPVLQQVLMPQPPIGPQSELLGFSYRSEPIEGEEDSWQIDMSYRVRILQQEDAT